MKTGVVLVLAALVAPTIGSQGASRTAPSLTIQGFVTLTVGMSESSVRTALTASNLELWDQNDGFFFVVTKVGDRITPSGDSVYFKNGRLAMATARWPTRGRADTNLADTLYGVLAALNNSRSCEISTKSTQQPGVDTKSITIECPASHRRVSILITRGLRIGEGVSVDETIF